MKNSDVLRSTLLLLTTSLGGSAIAADKATNGGESAALVDCASAITVPTDATDQVKAIYENIITQCAELRLRDVNTQVEGAKARSIAQALTTFGTINAPTGTITGNEKADHIGVWYAKSLLSEAAAIVGKQVNDDVKAQSQGVILITDSSVLSNKPELIFANKRLAQFNDYIVAAINKGNSALKSGAVKESDVPKDVRERMALLPLLTLIPPAVNAAQSLAALTRKTSTLSGIATSPDNSLLVSGLATCMSADARSKLLIPGYSGGVNRFVDAYDRTRATASAGRLTLESLIKSQAVLEKRSSASNTAVLASVASARSELETALKNFDAYDKYLNTAQGTSERTPMEIFIASSESLGAASTPYLVLNVAHYGANSGTVSRAFGSDKLQYMATTQISYVLTNVDGTVIKSGLVPLGYGSDMTVSTTSESLKRPKSIDCTKI